MDGSLRREYFRKEQILCRLLFFQILPPEAATVEAGGSDDERGPGVDDIRVHGAGIFDFLLIVPDDAFAVSPAVAVFAAKAAADGHAADGKFDDVVARFFSASFESGGEGARISMRPCAAVQDEDSQSLYTSFAKLNAAHAFGQPA